MGITHSNPFGRVPTNSKLVSVLVTSFHISCLYLAFTGIAVLLLSQATENRSIRFLASNTLWVFLCHMPLRDWLTPYYYPLVTGWHRQLFNFLLFFVALAFASQLVRWLLRVDRTKQWIAGRGERIMEQLDGWRSLRERPAVDCDRGSRRVISALAERSVPMSADRSRIDQSCSDAISRFLCRRTLAVPLDCLLRLTRLLQVSRDQIPADGMPTFSPFLLEHPPVCPTL
jgi:hypothetical protein